MISKKLNDAINKQINEEMFSAYLYLSMAAHFDAINLAGFSYWFKLHVREETLHAMKFYHHIMERGGIVELHAIGEPKKKWDSPLDAFEDVLKHEQHITSCINTLMDLAIDERDHAARNLLAWFVDEQVEEEANDIEIIEKLKLVGDQGHMLLMLDKELGARPAGPDPFLPGASEDDA